jgi:hypothetical protein
MAIRQSSDLRMGLHGILSIGVRTTRHNLAVELCDFILAVSNYGCIQNIEKTL